ncbi:hypothetical protein [Paenibacillus rigui]|uniref:Tryptophan-rich sensory protein n=1 Tax=Paenibacillus rigui TaxID=554312 RepID=A0A229UNZ0_9BACL|nr:hypothetical protein [Paenibacillus rigui]OXM85088.1 hypothetical protein CF651_15870 [Paenibacillus rigui]
MNTLLRWLNVVSLLAVLVVNWLATALPINGKTTGQISAMFPVPITPAPYAFSIWGLIYALLIVFVIVQFVPRARDAEEITSIGPWFIVSCFFNISWILLWQYLYITSSVFAMLGLLLSLAAVYWNTHKQGWSSDPLIRWGVQIPFSIYLGWITIAAIVNIAVALYAVGWKPFGLSETAWTMLLILIAFLVAVAVGLRFRDPAYVLVAVWALIAVGVANKGEAPIVYTAWAAAVLLFIFSIGLIANNRSHNGKFKLHS